MDIQKAVKEAMAEGCTMTRTAWTEWGLWIKPTNDPECCIIGMKGKAPCPRWQPQAEDLIADDWELVKESKE